MIEEFVDGRETIVHATVLIDLTEQMIEHRTIFVGRSDRVGKKFVVRIFGQKLLSFSEEIRSNECDEHRGDEHRSTTFRFEERKNSFRLVDFRRRSTESVKKENEGFLVRLMTLLTHLLVASQGAVRLTIESVEIEQNVEGNDVPFRHRSEDLTGAFEIAEFPFRRMKELVTFHCRTESRSR